MPTMKCTKKPVRKEGHRARTAEATEALRLRGELEEQTVQRVDEGVEDRYQPLQGAELEGERDCDGQHRGGRERGGPQRLQAVGVRKAEEDHRVHQGADVHEEPADDRGQSLVSVEGELLLHGGVASINVGVLLGVGQLARVLEDILLKGALHTKDHTEDDDYDEVHEETGKEGRPSC